MVVSTHWLKSSPSWKQSRVIERPSPTHFHRSNWRHMTNRPLNNWERRGERRRSRHLTNWEKRRDKKYVTEMVDEVRYTVNEENLELGRHSVHEEPPRSGKSEALCVESPADQLATHPNFKFGLITHSQALACKFIG